MTVAKDGAKFTDQAASTGSDTIFESTQTYRKTNLGNNNNKDN